MKEGAAMKLGVSAFAWTANFAQSHLRLVPLVKQMGFSGFEIAMFDPADLAITEIRRAFEASDLECTICAILPPDINPISPDVATRKKATQHLARWIETASALGAKLLGGPLYGPSVTCRSTAQRRTFPQKLLSETEY